jgi:hypothetical protein
MKASFHILISSLLCISLATAGSGAQADPQRPEVRARLVAAGVDAGAAEARVAALTDEEVALLATKFEELPAAAGGGNAVTAVLLVAIAVVVVVEFWPFFLIGGVAAAAFKADKRARNS